MNVVQTMPPGIYFVGDLCYVFTYENWRTLLDNWSEESCVAVTSSGEKCFMVQIGSDGVYESDDGRTFAIDSGTLGVIRFDLVDKIDAIYNPNLFWHRHDRDVDHATHLLSREVHLIKIDAPFECKLTDEHIVFHDIYIKRPD